jgi:hypothetical protein
VKIIVEQSEIELDLPERETTLQQVVEEVEDFLLTVGKVPIGLTIGDEELSQEEFEERLKMDLSGDERLTFQVEGVFCYLIGHLDGAIGANEELRKKIAEFASSIQQDDRAEVDGKTLVMELNHFFDFWFKMGRLVPEDVAALDFKGKEYGQLFEELGNLFREIVEAMEEQDFVLASDLLQYEVIPAVEAIDQVVPALKERLQQREEKDMQETEALKNQN